MNMLDLKVVAGQADVIIQDIVRLEKTLEIRERMSSQRKISVYRSWTKDREGDKVNT